MLPGLLEAGGDGDPAIVSDGETTTYGALRRDVKRLSEGLWASGVSPGSRVLVAFPNGPSFVVAAFAAWRCGAIVVPIDSRTPVSRAMGIARDCEVDTILADGSVFTRFEPQLAELPSLRRTVVHKPRPSSYLHAGDSLSWDDLIEADHPEVLAWDHKPTAIGMLAYTSGSTGRPKGVMHGHEGLVASLAFTRDHLGLTSKDRVLVAFPMYHLFSFRVTLAHLMVGATVIAERDLFAGLRRASDTKPNALALVPAACRLLVNRFASVLARLGDDVRRVSIGSAAISPKLLGQLRELLPHAEFHIPYGMTEARIGFLDPDATSSDRLLLAHDPMLELRVVDDDGTPVTDGIGELVLRGRALTLGYWHQRKVDNEVMRRDGLRTRDLMRVAVDGSMSLVGRLDDVISVGGEKVFPLEVEFALRSHPSVADARVTGVPDPVRGQIVHADVVLATPHELDLDALRLHCRGQLEPYKIPVEVVAVDEIPRNAMGKVVALPRS